MAILRCAINALKSQRRGFDYNFHNRVESGAGGLYAFWLDSGACLYVGMSTNLSERMYQHRMNEHNSELEQYFRAFSQSVQVSYIALRERSSAELRALEDKLISVLRPITNKS